MTIRFTAVYEHGLLRPTVPVSLEEGTKVEVIVVHPCTVASAGESTEILTEIAALPMEPGGLEFTGRDHDQILYGEQKAQ